MRLEFVFLFLFINRISLSEDPLAKTICIGLVKPSNGVSEEISIIFFDLSKILIVRADSSE